MMILHSMIRIVMASALLVSIAQAQTSPVTPEANVPVSANVPVDADVDANANVNAPVDADVNAPVNANIPVNTNQSTTGGGTTTINGGDSAAGTATGDTAISGSQSATVGNAYLTGLVNVNIQSLNLQATDLIDLSNVLNDNQIALQLQALTSNTQASQNASELTDQLHSAGTLPADEEIVGFDPATKKAVKAKKSEVARYKKDKADKKDKNAASPAPDPAAGQ